MPVEAYQQLYDALKGNPGALTMCTIPMLFASEVPLYFFTLLDYLALPSLYKYRLHYADGLTSHLGTRVYPPWDVVKAMSKVANFNFLFAYVVPGSLAIWMAHKLKIYVYDTDRNITWRRMLREAFMISIVADFMFYWLHRLLHTGELYLIFHKKHHAPKFSMAMAHHFMTYKEAVVFALPQALPPLVLWGVLGHRMHVTSMWFAFTFTQLAAILGHAGWKVPWPTWVPVLKPSYHDFHHVDFDCNFGAIYELWDYVFGTLQQAQLASPQQIVASLSKRAHDYSSLKTLAQTGPQLP